MSDVHIARTMQVAMQMAQAVAQSRAELQGERKAIAEEKKKDAKRASLPKGDAKDENKKKKKGDAKDAKDCNSHEYILRCSPPFVAGKGS